MDSPVVIVRRKEWMARDQDTTNQDITTNLFNHPVENIIITDTKTEYSTSNDVNSVLVKFIESTDIIVHNQNDIRYNFLIGGDGHIYEGCGWNVKGNHTPEWNDKSIGIGFIGDFELNKLNQKQIRHLNALIQDGIDSNKITKDCAFKILLNGQINDVDLSYDE